MKINKTHYAQQICEEGIKYFSQDIILYQQLILSLEAQKNFDAALLVLKNIQQKFPSSPYVWLKTAKIYLQIGNYEQANDVLKEAVCLFPENKDVFLEFAKLPLLTQDKNIWNESLERYSMFCHKFDLSYDNYKIALQDVYKVMKLNKDSDFSVCIYRKILDSFLKHFDGKRYDDIAIYVKTIPSIKFILPVVKCLPCKNIIVQKNTNQEGLLEEFGIPNANVFYGEKFLDKYKFVLVDHLIIEDKDYKCNFIGYIHATDTPIVPRFLDKLSLAIIASQKQMALEVISCEPLPHNYTFPVAEDCKCEICYTGPYHLGDFLERRHEPKAVLRKELAEELGIEIPEDKPLVFLLEDEISHIGQIAYAANKMSQYATVIYKSFLEPRDPRLAKFNRDIHITRGGLAPNLLRFSADYVCCGYMSGSFTTSVMLGQNVLPFYSRIVERRYNYEDFELVSYKYFIEKMEHLYFSAKYTLYSRFLSAGKLLDLVDAASMEKAILGTEYRDWYQANLPELQKEAFGDYMLEGSPQKTAEYIMRFVKDGTLGKDCSAIYLKETCRAAKRSRELGGGREKRWFI